MKKLLYYILAAATLTACHDNIEDRAARELDEYTRKNCPMKMSDNVSLDSMCYDRATRELRYCYTLTGNADTTMAPDLAQEQREVLVNNVRNEPSLKAYKDEGLGFRYTYYSQKNRGSVIFDCLVGEKDYK